MLAYLNIEGLWIPTFNEQSIIRHTGDKIVYDPHPPSVDQIEKDLQATAPTKVLSRYHSLSYIILDYPYVNAINHDNLKLLNIYNKMYVGSFTKFRKASIKKQLYYHHPKHPGLIGQLTTIAGHPGLTISYNHNIWDIINSRRLKRLNNKHKHPIPLVQKKQLNTITQQLNTTLDYQTVHTKPKYILYSIILHDNLQGKESTNEIIKDLAAQWLTRSNENEIQMRIKKFMTPEQTSMLTNRFKEAIPDFHTGKLTNPEPVQQENIKAQQEKENGMEN